MIMKRLEVTIMTVMCFVLSGCVSNVNTETMPAAEISSEIVESTMYYSMTATEVISDDELQQILLSQEVIAGYGSIDQIQILATDTRRNLSAVVIAFRNTAGQEFFANAVIKNGQVLSIQAGEKEDNIFLNYRLIGADEEEGEYTLYSGIVRDNKITDISFVYENGTVVNTKLSEKGGYCYLLFKKEFNNQDIIKIQQKDQKGNIVYEIKEGEMEVEETTYEQKTDTAEVQAMQVITNYYQTMYQAYGQGSVSEEWFQNCLDMEQVQNKNKITAMKKLNMNWNYFRTIYPNYQPAASAVALHLETITKKESDSYEAVVQIKGGKGVADYSPEDYLVGLQQGDINQAQSEIPPFVSLGQNIFQLKYREDQLLIQKHTYDGQKYFEGLDTVEVPFDPQLYQELLEQKRWGQN